MLRTWLREALWWALYHLDDAPPFGSDDQAPPGKPNPVVTWPLADTESGTLGASHDGSDPEMSLAVLLAWRRWRATPVYPHDIPS